VRPVLSRSRHIDRVLELQEREDSRRDFFQPAALHRHDCAAMFECTLTLQATPKRCCACRVGAPGAGKTTLLLALQARGHTIVADTARAIIQDRRRRGLTPRPDPYVFAREVLRIDIENFVHYAASQVPVFFERGVLDAVCGLNCITPLSDSQLRVWLSNYRYFSKVFVLPPWKAIYVNDAERDHTLEHAESVNRITQEWYRRCEYQVVEVPMVSVDERCTFVLQVLGEL
jgi:predicted ATPase